MFAARASALTSAASMHYRPSKSPGSATAQCMLPRLLKTCCTVLLLQAASHGVRLRQRSRLLDRTLAQRLQRKTEQPNRGRPSNARNWQCERLGCEQIGKCCQPAGPVEAGGGTYPTQLSEEGKKKKKNIVIGGLRAASSISGDLGQLRSPHPSPPGRAARPAYAQHSVNGYRQHQTRIHTKSFATSQLACR